MSDLPVGWEAASVAELGLLKIGPFGSLLHKNDYVDGGIPVINPMHIVNGEIHPSVRTTISRAKFDQLVEYRLLAGDVVLGRRGEMGRCAVVKQDQNGWLCGTGSLFIRPSNAIDPNYLQRFLSSPQTVALLEEKSVGSTMVNLNQKALHEIEIPLAPLNEQKRIAAKLDALLARVDACRDRLERVPKLLKRFRQAVLAAATSGELTAEWREVNPIDSSELLLAALINEKQRRGIRVAYSKQRLTLDDLPFLVELPPTWAVTCFDELAEAKRNALKAGPFGSALKKDMYSKHGYKVYGQEQVISGDESFGEYFVSEEKFRALEACAVKPGDILISLVGTIGKVLVLSNDALPGIINPRLVKLSLDHCINRGFISIYLRSALAQSFFRANSHGGTMDILNLGLLRALPILLPPLEEQAEIVRRVEALFALADRLEARYAAARKQVDKLTPALLAKAFRGELVPQDPTDEPASALLARIRANREAAQPAQAALFGANGNGQRRRTKNKP